MRPSACSVFGNVCSMLSLLCSGGDQVYSRVGRREADGGQSDGDVECELCKAALKLGISCSWMTPVHQSAY